MKVAPEHKSVEEIRDHVVVLFDAFLAGDTETLAKGRAPGWKGFQIRSTRLVRGIDEYVSELNEAMGGLSVERYEFLDFEVDLFGDLALVFYVARDYLRGDSSNPRTVLIRSLDIYQLVEGAWTQIASNICAIADPGAAGIAGRAVDE
jgi:hypothetical protein